MKNICQSWQFEDPINGNSILQKIERAGRTCYKSERLISDDSAAEFVRRMIASGHHSVIEHHNVTVRIVTDRGVTHEIVRHRLASYSQESTRYCDYSANAKRQLGISFIVPVDFELYDEDFSLLKAIEQHYNRCLEMGRTPQQARYFLPNGLKTEIVMTCNLREWRHFFKLRCSNAAHPQMRALARDMLSGFQKWIPVLFDDITY